MSKEEGNLIEITNLQKTFEDSDLTVLKENTVISMDLWGAAELVNPPFFGVLTV